MSKPWRYDDPLYQRELVMAVDAVLPEIEAALLAAKLDFDKLKLESFKRDIQTGRQKVTKARGLVFSSDWQKLSTNLDDCRRFLEATR